MLYPPHLIAIAALYVALILNDGTRALLQSQSQAHAHPPAVNPTRRSSRQHTNPHVSATVAPKKTQDIVDFLAGLNVSLEVIATIAQEIMALYSLWSLYDEDGVPDTSSYTRRPTMDKTNEVVTPHALSRLLFKMRSQKMEDMTHPSGRPVAVNKMLGRTQAAG